jgi:hypothetical protein
MTDRHNLVFFLILAGMIASLAAHLIDKHSLYDYLRVEYMRDLTSGKNKPDEISAKEPQPSI